MNLISGIHHIATATNDLDATMAFYDEVFELSPKEGFPRQTPVGRVAFYSIGDVEVQVVEAEVVPAPTTTPAILLQHGLRLDHMTVALSSEADFETVRQRLIERGASDGVLTPFGNSSLLAYADPDGHRHEIIFQPEVQ